ncbi:MAG: hypothetical protein ACFUZC_11905 [Chthoniobacteraceae bacterium]
MEETAEREAAFGGNSPAAAKPGDVIVKGQKDNRGHNEEHDIYLINDDWGFLDLTKKEAIDLLKKREKAGKEAEKSAKTPA